MTLSRILFSGAILGLFAYVISPLIMSVVMGGVFAVLCFPLLEKMERRKFSTGFSATLLTLGLTFGVLLPTAFLVFQLARTTFSQLSVLRTRITETGLQGLSGPGGDQGFFENLMRTSYAQRIFNTLHAWVPVELSQVTEALQTVATNIGLTLADALGKFITEIPSGFLATVIMVVSMFFFLIDGRRLADYVRRHSIFDRSETDHLISSFAKMCRSVILAAVISGFIQAILFYIFCLSVGAPSAGSFSLGVFFASFVPLIGSAPITFGLAVYHFFLGKITAGVVLLVGALAVSAVDNFVRPWVLKGAGNLHPLLAFIAAFGGLQVLGVSGVFLGPIIAGLALGVLQILLEKRAQVSKF
jgi:predicted PurR-regulated permease PerM